MYMIIVQKITNIIMQFLPLVCMQRKICFFDPRSWIIMYFFSDAISPSSDHRMINLF